MKFKLFDRVEYTVLDKTYMATFIEYMKDCDDSCLIVFDNDEYIKDFPYHTLHSGLSIKLESISKIDLPQRCRWVDEGNIKLLYSIGDQVEFRVFGDTHKGIYVAPIKKNTTTSILINIEENNGHDGDRNFGKLLTGVNVSTFIEEKERGYLYHEGDTRNIKFIKKTDIEKTKYKVIKTISGQSIVSSDPCKSEFNNYTIQYGFYDEIIWSKEIEEAFEIENGWITFLIDNGFIKENVDKIELDESKVYCFKWGESIYKICVLDDDMYNMCCISDTYYISPYKEKCSWDEFLKRHRHYVKEYNAGEIKTFDSIKQAIDYFM